MKEILTGKEIADKYKDIQNDEFADDRLFELVTIDKNILIDKVCCDGFSCNHKSFEEWENYSDNEDGYHTDTILGMVEYIKNGNELPPLIVNKNYGLYDGQHRLTCYMMLDYITKIKILKEV